MRARARDGEPALVAAAFTAKGETIVADPPLAAVRIKLSGTGRSFPRLRGASRPRATTRPEQDRTLAGGPRVPPRPGRRRGGVRAVRRGRRAPGVSPLPRLAPRGATGAMGPAAWSRVALEAGASGVPKRAATPRARHAMDASRSCEEGNPMFEFGKHARRSRRPSSSPRTNSRAALAAAGGSDWRPRARHGCGGGGGFRTRGRVRRRRRRTPPPPSRTEAPRRDGRVSSRVFPHRIQFHEVGRRPRASRTPPAELIRRRRQKNRRAARRAARRKRSASKSIDAHRAPVHGSAGLAVLAFGRGQRRMTRVRRFRTARRRRSDRSARAASPD